MRAAPFAKPTPSSTAAAVDAPTRMFVVPHSHWDREWYQPFQRFRMRLVDLVDRVLDLAERDPGFCFTFDGQLAAVDDYLAIRPQSEERVRELVERGQLAIGPWRVLADEFLCSGESLVRNLERGMRRAEQLGGCLAAGYLPDEFGHAAQMPQILRRAGLARAVVWRGVPAAIRRHAFVWRAPDGSEVLAEYLPDGYGHAAFLLAPGGNPVERLRRVAADVAPYFGSGPILAMCGGDHTSPMPDLVAAVAALQRSAPEFRLELATLAGYLEATGAATRHEAERGRLPRWSGELRSAARANLLVGVTSTRVAVKAACTRAERLLERFAEPLDALWGTAEAAPYLELAWDRVVDSAGHDSVTGCGIDAVAEEVAGRLHQAAQLAEGVTDRVCATLAAGVPAGALCVVNPSPIPREGLVELDIPLGDAPGVVVLTDAGGRALATQELARTGGVLHTERLDARRLVRFARRIHGGELFGLQVLGWRIDRGRRRLVIDLGQGDELAADEPWRLASELEAEAEAVPGAWQVTLTARPRQRLAAVVSAPALGWTAYRPVAGSAVPAHPVTAATGRLDNGRVLVSVEPAGTLRIVGQGQECTGIAALVDGGDAGDAYNYAPPARDRLVAEPQAVTVAVRRAGPVVGELVITRTYRWPAGLAAKGRSRSARGRTAVVETVCSLRAGEPFVRIALSFTNPCTDHRLRLHLPLPRPATGLATEGQFAVVERVAGPIEGGSGEVPLATHPARGFVDAGGLAVLLDQVSEVELLDGRALAVTVVRAIGQISRNDNRYREEPAGPEVATPGAQCLGPVATTVACYPHPGGWAEADVVGVAERYHHGLRAMPGTAVAGSIPSGSAGLTIEGAGVVLSALRRGDGWLELRLVLESPEPGVARIRGAFTQARRADLLGRPLEPIAVRDGSIALALAPFEIATCHLRR